MPGAEITRAEAAELAGVAQNTFSSYVARGQAPAPIKHIGSTPLWDADVVNQWVNRRPGQGARGTARAQQRAIERSRSTDVDE